MRYVPDLIPKDIKVLPDYFKGNMYAAPAKSKSLSVLFYTGAIIFFLFAFANLDHFFLAILFGAIGFLLLPQGHRWVEKKFRFILTPKIKTTFIAALFVTAMPAIGYYGKVDKEIAAGLKLKTEKEEAEKIAAAKKEQERKDSLDYYLQSAIALGRDAKIDAALNAVSYAANFSVGDTDRVAVSKTKSDVYALKTLALIKEGRYEDAIPELTSYLSADPKNADLLYNRAICYSKTGNVQEAVNDLKPLVEAENEEAKKLHEKINPYIKHLAYYTTKCQDGSTTDAKGSGACSHHGGVSNWNSPVYVESRKYQ